MILRNDNRSFLYPKLIISFFSLRDVESALPRGPRDQADAPSGVEVSDDSDTDYSDTEMLPSTSNGNSSNKKKQTTIVNKRKSSL